jgi:hypothetical protein
VASRNQAGSSAGAQPARPACCSACICACRARRARSSRSSTALAWVFRWKRYTWAAVTVPEASWIARCTPCCRASPNGSGCWSGIISCPPHFLGVLARPRRPGLHPGAARGSDGRSNSAGCAGPSLAASWGAVRRAGLRPVGPGAREGPAGDKGRGAGSGSSNNGSGSSTTTPGRTAPAPTVTVPESAMRASASGGTMPAPSATALAASGSTLSSLVAAGRGMRLASLPGMATGAGSGESVARPKTVSGVG